MAYPTSQDWRMGLALDRHDDPEDTETWAALAEDEAERAADAARDDAGWDR